MTGAKVALDLHSLQLAQICSRVCRIDEGEKSTNFFLIWRKQEHQQNP